MSTDWERLEIVRSWGSNHYEEGRSAVEVEECERCGAVVINTEKHANWHRLQLLYGDRAMLRLEQCRTSNAYLPECIYANVYHAPPDGRSSSHALNRQTIREQDAQ